MPTRNQSNTSKNVGGNVIFFQFPPISLLLRYRKIGEIPIFFEISPIFVKTSVRNRLTHVPTRNRLYKKCRVIPKLHM